jgi:hypothetical protein
MVVLLWQKQQDFLIFKIFLATKNTPIFFSNKTKKRKERKNNMKLFLLL